MTPIIELPGGALQGVAEDGLLVFRGVPYAAPPIGDLRWSAAQPHPGWTGIRQATDYGPSAPQPYLPGPHPILGNHGLPPFEEDCLTLNIWTPGLDDARRPVLVWLHGGGFVTGSGNLPIYAGDTFARNGDLVVVTVNYRIGALGFLSGLAETDNRWFTDQLAALRWVRDHIAAFGGDPSAITLAGQSGGAFSAAVLAGHGLFRRAILQSPPLGLPLPSAEESTQRTRALADALGLPDVRALRAQPWQRLVEGTIGLMMRPQPFASWPLPYTPVLGSDLADPARTLQQTGVEVLIGTTKDEFTFALGMDESVRSASAAQVIARLADDLGDRAATLFKRYHDLTPDSPPGRVLLDVLADRWFRLPALDFAARRGGAGRPVWVYQFDLASPAYDGWLGATHCLDLPFTFGNADRWGHAPMMTGVPRDLGDAMHQAWISFIRTGDPGWPPYTKPDRQTMRFAATASPISDLAGPWRELNASVTR